MELQSLLCMWQWKQKRPSDIWQRDKTFLFIAVNCHYFVLNGCNRNELNIWSILLYHCTLWMAGTERREQWNKSINSDEYIKMSEINLYSKFSEANLHSLFFFLRKHKQWRKFIRKFYAGSQYTSKFLLNIVFAAAAYWWISSWQGWFYHFKYVKENPKRKVSCIEMRMSVQDVINHK